MLQSVAASFAQVVGRVAGNHFAAFEGFAGGDGDRRRRRLAFVRRHCRRLRAGEDHQTLSRIHHQNFPGNNRWLTLIYMLSGEKS